MENKIQNKNKYDSPSQQNKIGDKIKNKKRKDTPLSAKQRAVLQQKTDSAQKIREEKQRLREEKKKRHQEFLAKAASLREKVDQNSEVRRLTWKSQENAAMASKQQEITERQWKAEQERLWKIDMKKKEQAEKEERLEREANERIERMEKEKREREEAEEKREADRLLENQAYQDVQNYLSNEKKKRRESIAMRLEHESNYKKTQQEQKELQALHEEEDRKLEELAYQDMKRYLASEKEKRRQSLANFLLEESMFRAKKEIEKDQQYEKALKDRELDDAAYKDMKRYEEEQKQARRLSIANRLQQESEFSLRQMMEDHKRALYEEQSRQLDLGAYNDTKEYEAEVKENRRLSMAVRRSDALQAAKMQEEDAEQRLRELDRKRKADILEYREQVLDHQDVQESDEDEEDNEDDGGISEKAVKLSIPVNSPESKSENTLTSSPQDTVKTESIKTEENPSRRPRKRFKKTHPTKGGCCVLS